MPATTKLEELRPTRAALLESQSPGLGGQDTFFEASLSGYKCSICSCTRTEVHHTHTPTHKHRPTSTHRKKIASFVISVEPARFCRRRARHTDHCGVTRGRRHETSPTTVSCTRKLTDPTPTPEHTTAKKRDAQSTLFHECDTNSLIRAPPGNHTSSCQRPVGEPHHEDPAPPTVAEEDGVQHDHQRGQPRRQSIHGRSPRRNDHSTEKFPSKRKGRGTNTPHALHRRSPITVTGEDIHEKPQEQKAKPTLDQRRPATRNYYKLRSTAI